MSRNGSGTYSLPAGNPVVTGTTITTTWANTTLSDISSALTGSVAADGQTPMTGALNMANNKVSAVADPTSAQDAATKTYVDTADTTNLALTLLKANNLSDVANATTSRTNLSAAKSGANSDITSITGLTTPLTVAQGGIGAATLTANNVLLGNGTSAPLVVAPGTSGNVLTSNGTTWTSAAATTTTTQLRTVVFDASGSWTAPAGVTKIFATVIGGGGGGSYSTAGCDVGGYGGAGGIAIGEATTVAGTTYTITIGSGGAGSNTGNGSAGGTSSIGSLMSATGGAGGTGTSANGANGAGTNGTVKNGAMPATDNTSIFPTSIQYFSGLGSRPAAASSTAALAWSISSAYLPGGRGAGESSNTSNNSVGGVGGAVVIQYVGA
jgi:hypothetical protein